MRVAELTVKELEDLITRTVEGVLVQLLPIELDEDGEMRDEVVARLAKQLAEPSPTMSSEEFFNAAGSNE